MRPTKTVGIVGAGIAGLICGYELRKRGLLVTLFEKEPQVGGRMLTLEKNGILFDAGTNFFVDNYHLLHHYCNELGIAMKWQRIKQNQIFGFWHGGLHPISLAPKEMLFNLTALPPTTRLRLLWELRELANHTDANFYNLSESTQYDTADAYNYIREKVGREAADYIIDAFTSTYQFHGADEISLATMVGLINEMVNHNDEFYLCQTEGGMRILPQAIANELEIHCNTPVQEVRTKGSSVELIANSTSFQYDALVLACTADVSSVIYKNPTSSQKQLLNTVQYAPTIMLSYLIPKETFTDFSLVMVPHCEGGEIAVYTQEGLKGDQFQSTTQTVINVALHQHFAKELLPLSDEKIFHTVDQSLRAVCPPLVNTTLTPHLLKRWPCAMPKFSHGSISAIKTLLQQAQGEQHLFFCGDYLNSPWTEGSARCGLRVAEQVAAHFGYLTPAPATRSFA